MEIGPCSKIAIIRFITIDPYNYDVEKDFITFNSDTTPEI